MNYGTTIRPVADWLKKDGKLAYFGICNVDENPILKEKWGVNMNP